MYFQEKINLKTYRYNNNKHAMCLLLSMLQKPDPKLFFIYYFYFNA